MSVTTLEEVFLRVANGTADAANRKSLAGISLKRQSSQSSTMTQAEIAKVCLRLTKTLKDSHLPRRHSLL